MREKFKKTGHIGLKSINWFLTIIILLILPLVVFTLISSKTDKLGGIKSFIVLSGSMEPEISTGSVIFTLPQKIYRVNDVIAFNKDGITTTHRVIERNFEGKNFVYKTKGDANNTEDQGQVLGTSVKGKQMITIPYLGRFLAFLTTSTGFVIFIIAPIILFILFELWNIKKEIERSIEDKYKKKMQMEAQL